jgi:hypothetical protein
MAAVLGTAAIAVGAVPATAASSNHTEPGTPGANNCHGQTIAAIAQVFGPGLGNAARSEGLTVHQVQIFVDLVCAS